MKTKWFKKADRMSLPVHQWLLVSACFSCLLLVARMIATHSIAYVFLPWNLFLAFIPYFIARWIKKRIDVRRDKLELLIAVLAWLLFIPNSFYIVTDFFHLTNKSSSPKWFDVLIIFSFAWNGIIYGILSIMQMENFILKISGKKISIFLFFAVMWLIAFGVYIGRYLRFNSWDVITNPFSLFSDILTMIVHPFAHLYPWAMIVSYSVFITFLYFTFKKAGEFFSKQSF